MAVCENRKQSPFSLLSLCSLPIWKLVHPIFLVHSLQHSLTVFPPSNKIGHSPLSQPCPLQPPAPTETQSEKYKTQFLLTCVGLNDFNHRDLSMHLYNYGAKNFLPFVLAVDVNCRQKNRNVQKTNTTCLVTFILWSIFADEKMCLVENGGNTAIFTESYSYQFWKYILHFPV